MSLTRERLNELMAQVAKDTCCRYTHNEVHGASVFSFRLFDLQDYSNQLLKAVEAECEVVGYRHATAKGCYANEAWVYGAGAKPLIAMPLVKG